MGVILWWIKAGLEVMCFFIGVYVFFDIIKNGGGTIKMLIRTLGLVVRTLCVKIQSKLLGGTNKETSSDEADPTKVDAHVV